MRKWGIWEIVFDILFVIGALLNVITGDATGWDYGMLYIAGAWLVSIIIRQVCREIEIQKKLKQMREDEKKNEAGQ